MDVDRYKWLGPKRRIEPTSHDDLLRRVREWWPTVNVEGSYGFERSYWVRGELVAHCWPVQRSPLGYWLRIALPHPAKEAG